MRKIIGGFVIILVGAYMGFKMSQKYKKREENLNYMIEALTIMQTRIGFCADRLGEIFITLSHALRGEMGALFTEVSEKIKRGNLPADAFWETLTVREHTLCFTERDMSIMEELCKQLGKNDCSHEICQIRKTIEELSQNKQEAQAAMAKEGKLTKSFCFLSSILLVILLM